MNKKTLIITAGLLFLGGLAVFGVIKQNSEEGLHLSRLDKEEAGQGHDHGGKDRHHEPSITSVVQNGHTGHRHETTGQDGHAELDHDADRHGQKTQTKKEDPDDHEGHNHENAEHEGHDHDGEGECEEGEICPEHLVAEIEDALCQSQHVGKLQPGEGMKVRLASLEAAERAGILTSRPIQISMAEGTGFPGRVDFNRNLLARIAPLASGIVQKVFVQPGARVEKEQVLAEIATPEIAALKAQLLSAQARKSQTKETYLREKDLLKQGITSRQEFLEAEAQYRGADSAVDQFRQQLSNYGLSDGDIQELLRTGSNSALLQVRAPFAGVVVEMETAMGESVSSGARLFTVADLDTLWIELSIPESRIYEVGVGAPVEARFDGLPETAFKGSIFQVSAALDERSRVLKALAEVDNPGHRLKAGMFGQVRIVTETDLHVLAVPTDALQSIDGAAFVFIRLEEDLFELRRVEAGLNQNGLIPVGAGILDTDRVVTSQGFALKSEVLKARLGASCADH